MVELLSYEGPTHASKMHSMGGLRWKQSLRKWSKLQSVGCLDAIVLAVSSPCNKSSRLWLGLKITIDLHKIAMTICVWNAENWVGQCENMRIGSFLHLNSSIVGCTFPFSWIQKHERKKQNNGYCFNSCVTLVTRKSQDAGSLVLLC